MMGASVILLAYKEAENLKGLLPQIRDNLTAMQEPFEILVIDSAVPLDDTEAVCIQYGARYIPQEEPHYGGAYRTGIRYAIFDKIQMMDADGSHDPAAMPAIYKKFVEGDDVVIGSRYVFGGVSNDETSSYVLSKVLNTVMRICIGVKAKDISTSYRLYHAEQLKSITLSCAHFDIQQEIILKLKLQKQHQTGQKLRIGEVPIVFNKRTFGESKRQWIRFVCGYAVSVFRFIGIRIKSIFV
jgi:dolichol-phosphate mannosyltransferase